MFRLLARRLILVLNVNALLMTSAGPTLPQVRNRPPRWLPVSLTFHGLTLVVLTAMAMFQFADTAAGAEPESLRVMSFNIRYGTAKDGEDHWKNRHGFVLDIIRAYDPDLLGTQETLGFQAEYLKKHLGTTRTYVGSSRDANVNGEQCGILFRTSRFELLDSGQFWLSETPDTKFSRSWDSSLPRVATWVRLMDRQNKSHVLFLNTHFDHRGSVARLKSAETIRGFLESQPPDLPVIVTGDFNCGQDSAPWKTFNGSRRLSDTYRQFRPIADADEGTFNGFSGVRSGARIDWILCSPEFQVKAADIVRTARNGKYPSDHFPVSTSIQFVRPSE